MKDNNLMRWNTRAAAVYAAGVWAIFGSYVYYRYTHPEEGTQVIEEVEEPENPNKVVYKTPHTTTVVTYKKDFVPYSTRIYNLFKSSSGGDDTGHGDK